MALVGFCSTKGGTGKTTLAFNLAERAHAAGLRVVVVDCDPQEGSIGLADLREAPSWPVVSSRVSFGGAERMARLRDSGEYDLVVCDLPGTDSMSLGRTLSEMDLVLSPVGVGPADIMAAANFLWAMQSSNLPIVFVPNAVPPGRARRDELVRELAERQAVVCPVQLQRRVAHVDALRSGQGVCEMAPESVAAREFNAFWLWVSEKLGLVISNGGKGDD